MNPLRLLYKSCIGLFLLLLAGCAATPPRPSTAMVQDGSAELAKAYAKLGRQGGRVFVLDPSESSVRIFAFRGGRAPGLGHDHVLSAPRFTGYLWLPEHGTAGARFDLLFRLDQLEIDNPALRKAAGGIFSEPLSAAAIAGVRAHMLGANNLQADRYPFVRIHSVQVVGDAPAFAAEIEVGMHGRKRTLWVPLAVHGLPGRLAVKGSFVLRQKDYEVRPYSVLGGLLAVRNAIVIEFTLIGHPARAGSTAPG